MTVADDVAVSEALRELDRARDRIVAIAEHLPPEQKGELAAVLKSIVGMAVMAAIVEMDELDLEPSELLHGGDAMPALMNSAMDAAMKVEPLPGRVDFADFISADWRRDA